MKKISIVLLVLAIGFIVSLSEQASAQKIFDSDLFSGIKARSIGPAGMSGRIAHIEVVESNIDIIYVGSATGGLWKSVNCGTTWKPVFDDQPVSSIGAVEVFQKNSSIVWVGTGEGNPRNSVGVGNGIFKSIDSGKTWKFSGLENTEKIHRIVLHPSNPDIAYVAALGTTWGENPERGVYKTINGGKSWEKILYIDKKTGCADLVMDPANPNKLIAAMWQHRRWPWFFKSGGPGSGLYITFDGGENWKEITSEDGLPKGELGRIGLGIAQNSPNIVYALIEAEKNCLCRSEDGGESWKIVNTNPGVNSRPFYYADIYIDPENENRIYSLQSRLKVSEDGGKSFQPIRSRIHPDHHALWIHPDDGSFMIDGNDGGVSISYDRGKTWRFVQNLPLAQFYHINIDMELPYNIYGGMQDNGSWRGPSSVWENGGIRNYHWLEVGFGDGFATLSDPLDSDIGYSMSQQGYLMRFNLITGEKKDIRPPSPSDSVELRFNWNAALAIDPFDAKTIYYGSQFVHKSKNKGENWIVISPDLTTNDPDRQKQDESGGLTYDVTGAENYTSIFTIAPSPLKEGIIWVGTDDGNVQLTKDGGKSWKNTVANIPDLPSNTWCSHIEPSNFEAAAAYAVFDDHRRSNWKTYIYKTEDYGRLWKRLSGNNPVKKDEQEEWGFAHVIRQDPVNRNLLYLGTEFGLYISFNDGNNWMKWTHGVPTVPVRDLIVHPREHDLVIGTHGRAAIVIDNISPLRVISEDLFNKPLHLFNIPDLYQHEVKQAGAYHFPADAVFSGENKPYGAMLTFYINPDVLKKKNENKEDKKIKLLISFFNSDSILVRSTKETAEEGINRMYWDLKREGFKKPSLSETEEQHDFRGSEVIPGKYTVKIEYGGYEDMKDVQLLPDPRLNISQRDYEKKYQTLLDIGGSVEIAADAVDRIKKLNKTLDFILHRKKNDDSDSTMKHLYEDAEELKNKLKDVTRLFIRIPNEKQGITGEDNVMRKFWYVTRSLSSSFDKPTDSQLSYLHHAEKKLAYAVDKLNHLIETDVKEFKMKLTEEKFNFFPEINTILIK